MRKNRELAETNRESMKQYTKLKMQYEKAMSKSTIASTFAKPSVVTNTVAQPGQAMYNVGQKSTHAAGFNNGGNSRIGVAWHRL